MTVAQGTEFPHGSKSSAREVPQDFEHDALNEPATMSSNGLHEDFTVASSSFELSAKDYAPLPITKTSDVQTQTLGDSCESWHPPHRLESIRLELRERSSRQGVEKIQFARFVEQLRQQQYFENKRLLLERRTRLLEKTIALSARLHRVSSWIGDGLVEISEQPDTAGFVRLHQHIQNLIELSYSQWDQELHALDPLGNTTNAEFSSGSMPDLVSKLSSNVQTDLFDLLSYLRSNPRFLVERFKVLAPSQIISLWSAPRFNRFPEAIESEYRSFTNSRGRLSSQRIMAYSKVLEEYASSFERSNPLAFLLFNMYGTSQSSIDAENQLRISTWSTVCAELMITSKPAFNALVIQLLDCFASLYEWQAKESLEMFLMDILQRGAFLLDQAAYANSTVPGAPTRTDSYRTPQAQEFFDTAVNDLFELLVKFEGGFPTGALQFASAVLDKLPLLQQQMDFRGIFFSTWFLEHFLQLIINYPENENMLLKFHVSNAARRKILRQLWLTVHDRVHDVYNEHQSHYVDPRFKINVETIAGKVDLVESTNPYVRPVNSTTTVQIFTKASITISISEIVQLLEALSPQVIHGSRSDHYRFDTGSIYGQYAQASGRFDRLKAHLISLQEPGSSVKDVHPCQEQWLQIDIDEIGKPLLAHHTYSSTDVLSNIKQEDLDSAQRGALRLFRDQVADSATLNDSSYRSDLLKSQSLDTMFRRMESYTTARMDPIDSKYWTKATDTLQERYPMSILVKDDSAVLHGMFEASQIAQNRCKDTCSNLEIQMSIMEDMCLKIRSAINKCVDRFESLRLKIWYSVDVVLSKHYDDAKMVSKALNNMGAAMIGNIKPSSRPLHSRPMSSASSMFDQPFEETMNIMKAPSSQGGPMKLSDKQIDLTKNWLAQTHIENFCKGEERIHRFCMEVYKVSRALVGETLAESPVLWASELFTRERSLFDLRVYSVTSAPASTRPASILSDTLSTNYRLPRPMPRSAESLRMALIEDRRMNGSRRINQDCLPPDLASSIGTPSRTHSATTAESINSVFTPVTSHTRSLTSASVHSRPASLFNDPGLSRFTDTARVKTKFLEKVRQVLVCLLLSDLGCPVWSVGSETDAMLQSTESMHSVASRLKHRMIAEVLVGGSGSSKVQSTSGQYRPRSRSLSAQMKRDWVSQDGRGGPDSDNDQQYGMGDVYEDRLYDLADVLRKLSQQVDPVEKLKIVEEFHNLSLTTLNTDRSGQDTGTSDANSYQLALRRLSLDNRTNTLRVPQQDEIFATQALRKSSATIHDITHHLKSDLSKILPKTLFRDLQYISAFVPSELTDNTSQGKALLQVGLAALAYKDEVCRSMVDVAERLFLQVAKPHTEGQLMPQIAKLWMFAARESNAVAQRELASLYLSRPELLPIISSPFSKPSMIFRSDMLWHERNNYNTNTPALCLAMHWMQQASLNGDQLARRKLNERKERILIR